MALSYCDICGVLIKGKPSADLPEGVICDACFDSRQVLVDSSDGDDRIQFECAYCRSLLRLPPVERKTEVRCPQCAEVFFLMPGGGVEARLQGSTTAILTKGEALRNLTPTSVDVRGSADLGGTQRLGPQAEQNKTQPLRPVSRAHKKILRDLKATNLDVVKELPTRELLPVDTKRSARERVGESPELKASEEGQVDLDVERLRTKTHRLEKKEVAAREEKAKTERRAAERAAERAERKREAERRAETALKKGEELGRTESRRSLLASLTWAVVLLPALVALLVVSMTVRDAGFVTRGPTADGLERIGASLEQGVRRLNEFLPAGLRTEFPDQNG